MSQYKFKMPDIGEGVTEAEITEWHVKVGDKVASDDPVCDAMTDKATVELTAPVSGIVTSVGCAAGEIMAVGGALIIFETDGDARLETESSIPTPIKMEAPKKQPRQMTFKRKLSYLLLKPVLILLVNIIWLSCRVKIIGQENMDAARSENKPLIPCYWHQQHLFCAWYMLRQIKRGMNVGFLVSP